MVLAAFNPESNDVPGALRVLPPRADTLAPTGENLPIRAERSPHNIAVRPTSAGFVVTYAAIGSGLPRVRTLSGEGDLELG